MSSIPLGNEIRIGTPFPLSFPVPELARHSYFLGRSGGGKSSFLLHLIKGLSLEGEGIGLFDPHADLAHDLLVSVPPSRLCEVVYLSFSDPAFSPALNLVSDSIPLSKRPLIASALLSAFKHIWSESWGPRLEYLLFNGLRAIIDAPNTSLISLPRFLIDQNFRRSALKSCSDPFIRSFWLHEFESWDKRLQMEAISPLQNKLGQFVANPFLREAFGQVPLKVDFREVMDSRKILIVNLSKGMLGDEPSRLAGALLTSFISTLAMSRADQELAKREPFFLALDECQNFMSDALSSALSEARKYKLSLMLSNQALSQLPSSLKNGVLGNAGNLFCFNVAAEDAESLSLNFAGDYQPSHFVELKPFHVLVRPHRSFGYPFELLLDPPPALSYKTLAHRKHLSFQKYYTEREVVREKQKRWLSQASNPMV